MLIKIVVPAYWLGSSSPRNVFLCCDLLIIP